MFRIFYSKRHASISSKRERKSFPARERSERFERRISLRALHIEFIAFARAHVELP